MKVDEMRPHDLLTSADSVRQEHSSIGHLEVKAKSAIALHSELIQSQSLIFSDAAGVVHFGRSVCWSLLGMPKPNASGNRQR